jgi:hypothetical protein
VVTYPSDVLARAVVCVFVGHRWVPPSNVNETYPVFECERCGRRQEFAQGTTTPYNARLSANTGRDKAVGGFGTRR